jgi:hypothetical protein
MKRFALVLLFLSCGSLALAADQFWQQLTPAERAAAGLDQLSPEQRAALDRLAERYAKEGARQAVEVVKAETAVAVKQAREEAKAQVKAEARKQKIENAGLAARDDDEVIHTRIAGDFRGWAGGTVFKLQNGQVWQQTDKEDRFFPNMPDTEVALIPSKLIGWKMEVVKEGLAVKVKRIR